MKTSSGISVMIYAVILLLGMTGCGSQTALPTISTGGGQNTSTTPATAVVIAADPETTITNMMNAFSTAPSYHTTTTITANDRTTTMNADVILPDRFDITTERNGKTAEMLIVGAKSYTKVKDQWVDSPFDIGSMTASFANGLIKDTKISNVKFVKSDNVNGQPANVYTFDSLYAAEGLTVESATTVWIDTITVLPVKFEIESTAAGVRSHTEQLIQYDPNIKIEAPVQ